MTVYKPGYGLGHRGTDVRSQAEVREFSHLRNDQRGSEAH
jgi:hypothetical protein